MGIWPDGGVPKFAGGVVPVCARLLPVFPDACALDGANTALNPDATAISAARTPVLNRFTDASLKWVLAGESGSLPPAVGTMARPDGCPQDPTPALFPQRLSR